MSQSQIEFAIGPVQGFVAKSRRTRDLWGSSYLLSFLSAHAMQGAEQAGGTIVQPVMGNDPLYRWVAGEREGNPPQIGSVPNQFRILTEGNPAEAAEAAHRSFRQAWSQVCDAVWQEYLAAVAALGQGSDVIWHRQVNTFWDVTWIVGGVDEVGLLARRKYWRSHRPPDEPGDKCTILQTLQELSGYTRSIGREARERQDEFWSKVRGRLDPLDLRADEWLCAIALVKRLFPKLKAALGWKVDVDHWPSTVYVGATPWIECILHAAPERARQFAERVREFAGKETLAEREPPFASLAVQGSGDFAKLDANYFHATFLRDQRLCPLTPSAPADARAILSAQLKELRTVRLSQGEELGSAPVFYALLLADGDRLGELLGRIGGARVGAALGAFTGLVPDLVHKYQGVTVYAGGDDVLALLPIVNALECASSLSEAYEKAFDGDGATLSAAIVFAHARLPLSSVLREAHRLLDDVAKEGNGRGSLAVAVLKHGGLHCQWTSTWRRETDGEGAVGAVEKLLAYLHLLGKTATGPGVSAGLLYRLRSTLSMLCGWPRWVPGMWGEPTAGLDLKSFVSAELAQSLQRADVDDVEVRAEALAIPTVALLRRSHRHPQGTENLQVGMDALLLANFLAGGGREEEVS